MSTHVKIIGWLHIIFGVLGLLTAFAVFGGSLLGVLPRDDPLLRESLLTLARCLGGGERRLCTLERRLECGLIHLDQGLSRMNRLSACHVDSFHPARRRCAQCRRVSGARHDRSDRAERFGERLRLDDHRRR